MKWRSIFVRGILRHISSYAYMHFSRQPERERVRLKILLLTKKILLRPFLQCFVCALSLILCCHTYRRVQSNIYYVTSIRTYVCRVIQSNLTEQSRCGSDSTDHRFLDSALVNGIMNNWLMQVAD